MSNPEIDAYGNKRWRNEKGQLHREDGPAIEYTEGSKYWYLNNEIHREDGPAIECPNGTNYWYLNGEYHSEQEFKKKINATKVNECQTPN